MEANSLRKYENGFTTVDNEVLRKLKLSVKALGIWVRLLSLPNNWKFSKKGLESIMGIGRNGLNSGLKELENEGLFCIEKIYPTKEKPLMTYRYCVFPNPNKEEVEKLTINKQIEANQGTGFQVVDNQAVDNQAVDNPPPYKESINQTFNYKTSNNTNTSTSLPTDQIDYNFILDSFKRICTSLPKPRGLNEQRKRAIRSALKNYSQDDIIEVFKKTEASDFLTARRGKWNATFDWIFKPANTIKILEGNYDNKEQQGYKVNKADYSKQKTDKELSLYDN